ETETAEIIRRRLFDWSGLPDEAKKTAAAYAEWVQDHREMVGYFAADAPRERFQATDPFHPALLSVFERKWQSLPRFQKTRGVLRLLALWVAHTTNFTMAATAWLLPSCGIGDAVLRWSPPPREVSNPPVQPEL